MTNLLSRKELKKEDLKEKKKLIKAKPTHPDPTKLTRQELDKARALLSSDEELHNKEAIVIMSTFKDKNNMSYCSRHAGTTGTSIDATPARER
jgi:hypothetical protein